MRRLTILIISGSPGRHCHEDEHKAALVPKLVDAPHLRDRNSEHMCDHAAPRAQPTKFVRILLAKASHRDWVKYPRGWKRLERQQKVSVLGGTCGHHRAGLP